MQQYNLQLPYCQCSNCCASLLQSYLAGKYPLPQGDHQPAQSLLRTECSHAGLSRSAQVRIGLHNDIPHFSWCLDEFHKFYLADSCLLIAGHLSLVKRYPLEHLEGL